MNKVLAISGGVDSMVLLHLFLDDPDIIVAHFNHGTRPSADDDEIFVRDFCAEHHIPFCSEKLLLGENVSEERAREARYTFLRRIAQEYHAEIYTAHHTDDLVESIAINLLRGTGHRGLAPLTALGIRRPFLDRGWSKRDILRYASEHSVTFRQDPTNVSDDYLRNRVRAITRDLPASTKQSLYDLFLSQKSIEAEISTILECIVPEDNHFYRADFAELDSAVAMEILRFALSKVGISATRPQLADFLTAIRTYRPGKKFNLPDDQLVRLDKNYFML